MEIEYKNKFSVKETKKLANEICKHIKLEENLTNRPVKQIIKLMQKSGVWVALNRTTQRADENIEKKIIGVIMVEHFYKNYYEGKSLYVIPEFRGHGIGNELMKLAFSDNTKIYFGFTFALAIVDKVKQYGFKVYKLSSLPIPLILKIVFSRNIFSIIKHTTKQKSYLVVKK